VCTLTIGSSCLQQRRRSRVISAQNFGPSLDSALKLIGADVAHAHGLTGSGVRIAIVDTGIDNNHQTWWAA